MTHIDAFAIRLHVWGLQSALRWVRECLRFAQVHGYREDGLRAAVKGLEAAMAWAEGEAS